MEELLASGAHRPSQRRQAGPAHRLHPVRRLPGQGAPALLLGGLLPREHQAGAPAARARPRVRGLRPVQGHPHAGPVRGLLPQGPGGPGHLLHQGARSPRVDEDGTTTCVVKADNTLLGEHIQLEADLVVLATGMVPAAADGEAIRRYTDAKAVVAKGEAGAQLEAAKETVEKLGAPRGHGDPEPGLPPGAGPAGAQVRLPRLALHLLPLRVAPHRHLCRRRACAPRGRDARREDGAGAALKAIQSVRLASRGRGGASALGRHVVPGLRPAALHPVQALHRGVSLRHAERGREGHAPAQPHALPPLRHLHGRVPRADHLVQGLLGRHRRRR